MLVDAAGRGSALLVEGLAGAERRGELLRQLDGQVARGSARTRWRRAGGGQLSLRWRQHRGRGGFSKGSTAAVAQVDEAGGGASGRRGETGRSRSRQDCQDNVGCRSAAQRGFEQAQSQGGLGINAWADGSVRRHRPGPTAVWRCWSDEEGRPCLRAARTASRLKAAHGAWGAPLAACDFWKSVAHAPCAHDPGRNLAPAPPSPLLLLQTCWTPGRRWHALCVSRWLCRRAASSEPATALSHSLPISLRPRA